MLWRASVGLGIWSPCGAGHVAVYVIRIFDCIFAFESFLDISYVFAHDDYRTVAVV